MEEGRRRRAGGGSNGTGEHASGRTLNDVMATEVVDGRGLAMAGRAVSGTRRSAIVNRDVGSPNRGNTTESPARDGPVGKVQRARNHQRL
jgi:hypothetical protein